MRAAAHRTRGAVLAVVGLAALAPVGVALAAWFADAINDGHAVADTLTAGQAPAPTLLAHTVTLTWAPSTLAVNTEVAADGYEVRRYAEDGTEPLAADCVALVPVTTCVVEDVEAGRWEYTVTPTLGEWRGPESARSAVVEVRPPQVALAPDQIVNTTSRSLTGLTLSGFRTGEIVDLTIATPTGDPVAVLDDVTTDAQGDATVAPFDAPAELADGEYVVRAVGPRSTGVAPTVPFLVDTTAPAVDPVTVPEWANADVTVELRATDTAPGRVTGIAWSLDGGPETTVEGDAATVTVTATGTLTATAVDSAGNRSEPVAVPVRIDRIAPTPAPIVAPPFVTNGVELRNDATDEGGSGVANVTFLWCAGAGCTPTEVIGEPLVEPPYALTWSGQPTDGSYRLAVVVTDRAGNTTTSPVRTLGVDNVGPTGVVNPLPTTVGALVPLTATVVDDLSGVESVTFEYATGTGPWTPIETVTTGILNVYGAAWNAGELTPGPYRVRAVAMDAAGNQSALAERSTVLYGPTTVQLLNGTGVAGQIDRGDRIVVTYNAAPRVIAMCPGAWLFTPTPLVGTVTITIVDGGEGPDRLTIASANCAGGGNFGSVTLGSADYVGPEGATFRGSGARSSRIVLDTATRTLTVTIGDLVTGAVAPIPDPTVATYVPSPLNVSANLSIPAGTPRTAAPGGIVNF